MDYRRSVVCSALALATVFGWSSKAAPSLELVRLVDSATPVPGGAGNFFLDNVAPAPCNLGVVFEGADVSPLVTGIYVVRAGGIEVIADSQTPVPGGVGNFERAGSPACEGNRVAFGGRDSVTNKSGIYLWEQGVISPVVTNDTPSPHSASTLIGLGRPAMSSEAVVFRALDALELEEAVLAASSASLLVIADEDTAVPGQSGSTLTQFSNPSATDELATFRANFSLGSGIYSWDGIVRRVADVDTPVPGSPGETFSAFRVPSAGGSRIVFGGRTDAGWGLYLHAQGQLEALFPPGTLGTDGQPIIAYDKPRLDGPRLAFLDGDLVVPRVLYLSRGAGLERVLGEGDILDGLEVTLINHEMSHGMLAMRVQFVDSSQAIYAVDLREAVEVPSLGPFGLVALVLFLAAAAWARLRRQGSTQ